MLALALGWLSLAPLPRAGPASLPALRPAAAPPRVSELIGAGIYTPATAFEATNVRYAARDWVKTVVSLPNSMVLKRIASPLVFNFWVTTCICGLHITANMHGLPRAVTRVAACVPNLPPIPHTLLGSALGLLLVFRTNAAYDRFWEARKQWGTVTSECRALASLACTFMTPQQALPLLTLIAAFPVILKNYLRGERDVRRLKALLAPQEVAALAAVVNQPQYMLSRLRMLAQQSSACGVSEKEREIMLKSASVLGECVSTCERIYNTPIPLAYSRHTSRFLVLYVSTLPLVLVSTIGWTTVPVMVTISWALFGILEIGNLIEEPFTAIANSNGQPLLPLKEVCRIIRRDVRACAQYAALAKNYSVPSIRRSPMGKVALPEGFKQLRVLLSAPSSNATMSSNSSRTNADAGS